MIASLDHRSQRGVGNLLVNNCLYQEQAYIHPHPVIPERACLRASSCTPPEHYLDGRDGLPVTRNTTPNQHSRTTRPRRSLPRLRRWRGVTRLHSIHRLVVREPPCAILETK